MGTKTCFKKNDGTVVSDLYRIIPAYFRDLRITVLGYENLRLGAKWESWNKSLFPSIILEPNAIRFVQLGRLTIEKFDREGTAKMMDTFPLLDLPLECCLR